MANRTLSVIIPNFNKSTYIQETIESILNQTYRPSEIIIVDDASTDISKEIIKEYARNFPTLIKVCFFPVNCGVQKARSHGVNMSSGEFITFIDSDDFYYDSRKLEKEMALASEGAIVYSPYCVFNNIEKKYDFPRSPKRHFRFYRRNQIYCYLLMRYMECWPFAFIVSRQAFHDAGGYNFPFDYYEDLDLLIRYARLGLKPIRLDGFGLAVRTNTPDISHLSAQEEKHLSAMGVLRDRYYSAVPIKSRLFGRCINDAERLLSVIKRNVRKK